jgi:hypothetical protein
MAGHVLEKDLYKVVLYICNYRSVQVWHSSLTGEQCQDIEKIQRRELRIIYPEMTYNEALFRGY